MPRGKPKQNRGGHTAAKGTVKHHNEYIAGPKCTEFPSELMVNPKSTGVPNTIVSAFPEFSNVQPYFSALEKLAPEYAGSVHMYKQCWVGVDEDAIERIERDPEDDFMATLKLKTGEDRSIFVKRIHLLDPVSAMMGEYAWPSEGALPAPSDLWRHALAKINDPLNEAYVDALYASVASKFVEANLSPHWLRCYGTFTSRVEKYVYDISEEYDSMRQKPWWRRNQRMGLFTLYKDPNEPEPDTTFFTEGLTAMDADDFVAIEDVSEDAPPKLVEDACATDSLSAIDCEPEAAPVRLTTPRVRLKRLHSTSPKSGGGSSHASEDVDDDDCCEKHAEFTNFPVQVTLLEYADGTMDDLLDEETDEMKDTKEDRWGAWLFQVIAGLAAAQYWTGFVHNDLHTDNVMWSGTGQTHLYYKIHKGKETYYMAIPTYGRLLKIIDFGRASFTLPEPAGFFISDAFYPGNDAGSQYNCEPFYDPKEGKKVEPNTSFDLARLAVSLIESLYPTRPEPVHPVKIMSKEGAKMYTETQSPIYNMLWEWLTDDDGKNVLRKPNGEERYPDFDLYRALASDVHRAIPKKQIERDLFKKFRCDAKSVEGAEQVYNLYI